MFVEIQRDLFSRLPFALHSAGESLRQSPVDRFEGFEWHEFIWVKEGTGNFTAERDSFTISEGYGVFLRRGTPHSYHGEKLHTGWVTFSADDCLIDFAISDLNYKIFKCPEYLDKETSELIRMANSSETPLIRSSVGYAFVTELFTKITEESVSKVVKVKSYLERNFSKPLTLEEIAASVSMDKFALCRYYLKETGKSVMTELNLIRIAKAKRYLRYSSDSSAAIGYICGFESPSYFSKRFKESVGCTPVEYRERYNKK